MPCPGPLAARDCLPTPLHADHVIRAFEAGKHVLCELPLASDLAGAHRIVAATRSAGRQVFVDMFNRFDPAIELLTESGTRAIDLPAADADRAVIDHVIECCQGRATSRLDPASVLDSLQLTHEIHDALTD